MQMLHVPTLADHSKGYRRMYAIWWSLFFLVDSFLTEDHVQIEMKTATKDEGSCVIIPCSYKNQSNLSLLWLKDAVWNTSEFKGTTVYSNMPDRPQDTQYSGRVEFPSRSTSAPRGSCTLRITDLRKKDSGAYSFRIISQDKHLKFISPTNMSLTVKDNPCRVWLEPPSLNSLTEGETVNLRCLTLGSCEHAPKWAEQPTITRDAEHVSELKFNVTWKDDGRTLSCSPAQSTDDCLVRNITLAVHYAPKDTKIKENSKDVKEGESVSMSCSSKAKPNATFTWFKVDQSQPLASQSEQWALNSAEQKDSGEYYCKAQNRYGVQTSSVITINVIYAPKGVHVKSEPTEVQVGNDLTLECLVEDSNPGVSPGSFRWYKNGEEIMNQMYQNTFYIQTVQKSDQGLYHCQAKNYVGATPSNKITINVKYPPQDIYIKGMNTVNLHLSLLLTCLTDANPDPISYTWFHKPKHGQSYAESLCNVKDYRIEKVTVQDAGWYMCRPRNEIGMSSNSTEFNVDVVYAPQLLILTMAGVIKENELLSVGCTVDSNPVATIDLRFTKPEHNPVILKRVHSNTLQFSVNATESNAGMYTCEATNTAGTNSTTLKKLKVLYAPKDVKVVAHPGQELSNGDNLTLTCEARSEPSVSLYTWQKLSGTNKDRTKTAGYGQTLTIHSLSGLDSGEYICIAKNDLSSSLSAPVHIRVKYFQSVKIIHNLTSTWEFSLPVHLMCSVQCYPPAMVYKWYMSGHSTSVLSRDQNYTAQPQNPGTYYCFARNVIGNATSDPVQLFVNPPFRFFQVLIAVLILCFVIAAICLLCRYLRRKGASGQDVSSLFFSETLSRSSAVAGFLSLVYFSFGLLFISRLNNLFITAFITDLKNTLFCLSAIQSNCFVICVGMSRQEMKTLWLNKRSCAQVSQNNAENLVSGREASPFRLRDAQSSAPAHLHSSSSRDALVTHCTVYDVVKMPQSTEKVPTTSTVNYDTRQFNNDLDKSAPSTDCGGPIYSVVSKNKQNTKCVQSRNEDYENISGAAAPKPALTHMNWASDTSEEEEEEDHVNYSMVVFTATPCPNPRKCTPESSSDEEVRTEYSQVKVL